MSHLLQPRIWPSFRASSGLEPCDVPTSTPQVRVPAVTPGGTTISTISLRRLVHNAG